MLAKNHHPTLALQFLLLFGALFSVNNINASNADKVIHYNYKVIKRYPHDPDIFTQGLEFYRGSLYESAGQLGQSRLIKRSLQDKKPLLKHHLDKRLFAEGVTVLDNRIYQLTWRAQRGFVYDPESFMPIGSFNYQGEGWGLTNNGKQLILSNGSNRLQFINPDGFSVSRTVQVRMENKPVHLLNELEWVNGLIYANIWQTDWIVMIDPATGKVVGKVLLKDLLPNNLQTKKTDVLNGIAFDNDQQRLLVTGKYWPQIFHIELIPN